MLGIVWSGRADLRRSGPDRPILALDNLVLPESLESIRCEVGVPHGVRDVPVTEVVLEGSSVVALVGELVAAGVPQHVRVDGEVQLGRRWVLAFGKDNYHC